MIYGMPIVLSPVRAEYQPDRKRKVLLFIVRPSKRTLYFRSEWHIFSPVSTAYTDDLHADILQGTEYTITILLYD